MGNCVLLGDVGEYEGYSRVLNNRTCSLVETGVKSGRSSNAWWVNSSKFILRNKLNTGVIVFYKPSASNGLY